MKTTLDCKKDFLCVLVQRRVLDGPLGHVLVKEWYPVHQANETEARALVGRPVTAADSSDGIYVDEDGNLFELADKGETKPLETERVPIESKPNGDLATLLEASLRNGRRSELTRASGPARDGRTLTGKKRRTARARRASLSGIVETGAAAESDATDAIGASLESAPLNLRQKLALVRRRLGYIQKRGHNELRNYRYVTAADLAGAVGDILAELGVVVIPRLESIAHEPLHNGRANAEHLTHVVMNYSFVDVDTAEEITVKVAGEGQDPGDKAPYKAMTGALKYALLQSFLLATGDDPEDERGADSRITLGAERVITPEQARELQRLIEETGTELERVLAYYRISALGEMTEGSYRRALELLNRKLAKQGQENGAHAEN